MEHYINNKIFFVIQIFVMSMYHIVPITTHTHCTSTIYLVTNQEIIFICILQIYKRVYVTTIRSQNYSLIVGNFTQKFFTVYNI